MAETFFCNGNLVHFTNGGCHELYLTWSKCAAELGYAELSEQLLRRTKFGWGFAADGIDEEFLSDEFIDISIRKKWLESMQLLIKEISSKGKISEEMDVNWDDELREYWISKLTILKNTLSEQVNV